MVEQTTNNRLVKNTIMLYVRTLLIMVVSLYTVRVILSILGVDDYGIYSVVGGIVISLSVITASLSGASSRFISYAIGKGDSDLLKIYFSTIKLIHWILCGIIFLIGETIGLWFVMYKLVIPDNRLFAAILCYQFCLFTSLVSVVSVPYNSMIMGQERMDVYAYISIVEATLKLLIVFLLTYLPYDKLIMYGILLFLVQISIRLIYNLYCTKTFVESKVKMCYNKELFRKMFTFAGWSFTGQLAYIGYTQGINILMNLFFGPVVNAARGVANQVQNGAGILVKNFQVAVRPQITKCWAQEDILSMHNLVIMTTKFSYYLTAIMVFPLVLFAKPILKIWLMEVPDHSVTFVQIVLFTMLIEAFSHALIVAIHAVGDLKKFQIFETSVLLLVIPVAYVLLKFFNITAEQVMIVYMVIQCFAQLVRMYVVLPRISMPIKKYILGIFPRILTSTLFFAVPLFFIKTEGGRCILSTIIGILVMTFYMCIITFSMGLTCDERRVFIRLLTKKYS
ncbi:oligosaccharide flippase family protein [uncultured Parabacteroides sp.]|uniref:lipopolysaccharide biosynthesis protein n=1 Tax=uncultured Parabacteroides sp. TaxID=512312 RepID=UPI002592C516|nr:oligosaccharide flippase family protein [uncultured Parabacteroides sp.]